MVKVMRTDGVATLPWLRLNEWLAESTEEEALACLHEARHLKLSPRIILRIYSRYNKLRVIREREELGA